MHENPNIVTDAERYAVMAISQLERIPQNDPARLEAFDKVVGWIQLNR
jgi:hypothetical protein